MVPFRAFDRLPKVVRSSGQVLGAGL
jgi:hypothetical protein